jgi:hypothetical protein
MRIDTRNSYRIMRDSYAGYEVQFKPRFWPFWMQCFGCNTHRSIESAKAAAIRHANKDVYEYLGRLP